MPLPYLSALKRPVIYLQLLKEFRNKHDGDMADIKHRLTALERGMGVVKRDASDYYEGQVGQQITIAGLASVWIALSGV